MKKLKRMKSNTSDLGERNLLTRVKIVNSFNLSDEAFLKKYYCDRETLFRICLPSFKKLLREKSEVKFISLYLFNLKKFSNLLKSNCEDNMNPQKNTDNYIKLLKYVSENINYESNYSNRLIMRYGDKGDKYYIILHGLVSIIIPFKINIELSFHEYSRYIALLLLYKEFELAKIMLRDNKSAYTIDLPEIKFIIKYMNRNNIEELFGKDNKKKYVYSYSIKNKRIDKNINKQKIQISKYLSTKKLEIYEEEKNIDNENAEKFEKFMSRYLNRNESFLFRRMKYNDYFSEMDENPITPDAYINRLKNYKNFYFNDPKLSRYTNNQLNEKKKSIFIYEYQEIIQLETGEMFGDMALNNSSTKRTATIISLVDTHFGCLNREIYKSIKESSEKNRKNMINFIYNIKLFNNINYNTMEDKYFNYFAFKFAVMDEYILKKGSINSNLIIIKNGTFEISFKGNLNDIYNLMDYYKESYKENFSNLDEKKYKLDNYLIKKINKLILNKLKIKQLLSAEKDKNPELKLFLTNNTSILGLRETEKKKGNDFLSFFDIKCISNEGEYFLLDKRIFYRQIYGIDSKTQEETKLYVKEFVEKTINRFVHILYSKMWSILTKNDMKIFKSIKRFSFVDDEKKNMENNNLMHEIGLDFDYMNKYNLTDIECIIDKILIKYNEDAFDYKGNSTYLYNFCEKNNKMVSQKKNMIKLDNEKYDSNKFKAIFQGFKTNKQKNYIKLINSQKNISLINKGNSEIIKINKNNKSTNLINYNNNVIKEKRKSIFTPKTMKNSKTCSTFYDDKKTESFNSEIIKNKKSRNINLKKDKDKFYYNRENTKNFLFLPKGKSIEPYNTVYNISNKPSKIPGNNNNSINNKYSSLFKRVDLSIDFDSIKKNSNIWNNLPINKIYYKYSKIFDRKDSYKYNRRCISAKHSNNSYISFLDSSQIGKDYIEQRKEYILRNTRYLFTRNKNMTLYKRIKKKVDKNV